MALHIISVGGSLIVPQDIDVQFLKEFKAFILKRIEEGDRFVLIGGGGKICRVYQDAAKEISELDDIGLDWIGTYATQFNSRLLKEIFGKHASEEFVTNYEEGLEVFDSDFNGNLLIGAGWKPGWSSDYDAVLMAKKFNAKSLINLSNIEYVYSDDPRTNPDAKRYENLSWEELQKIVGSEWSPGLSAPFDPIATKLAAELGLTLGIMNGKDLENVGKYLDGKEFKGTKIYP
jgi:uridylate kinase